MARKSIPVECLVNLQRRLGPVETLFEKYRKRIIEYESLRMITKAEIRRAEMAGDEHEAEKQRIEMERFNEMHGLCVSVVEDLEQFAVEVF